MTVSEMTASLVRSQSLSTALLGLMLLMSGCGGGPKGPALAPAKGVVLYQGKPLTTGQICFMPDKSKGTQGPMASSSINEKGEFELRTFPPEKGAVIGFHKVIITSYKSTAFDPNNPSPPLQEISLIPARYGDEETSGLTAEVVKDAGKNVYTFELK